MLLVATTVSACSSSSNDEPVIVEKEYPVSQAISAIPLPPEGKRWIVNELFSDEFNDGKLDDTKWYDHHPTWIGRTPGLFMSSQISFKDGMMMLKGNKMNDTIINAYGSDNKYNVACAAVVSKTQKAHYGYYECRFKANKTTLSSTFWLSSRNNFKTEGRQPADAEQGIFSQELDICECIGRSGDFSGKSFCEGMNSNVHYWFSPTGGEKSDIRSKEVKLKRTDGNLLSDDFNVFGCWWKDASHATFYLNNTQSGSTFFENRDTKKPFLFTEPMGLNMVVETYPQPWISLPTDEELSDDTKNTTYYDWVRAYLLVDMDEKIDNVDNSQRFENHINLTSKKSAFAVGQSRLDFPLAYTASKDCFVKLVIFDEKNNQIDSSLKKVYSGYGNLKLSIDHALPVDKKYTAVVYLGINDTMDDGNYLEADSFKFTIE